MPSPAGPPASARRIATGVCWAIVAVALLVYVVHAAAGLGTDGVAGRLLDGWLYEFLVAAGGMAVLARVVLVREERLAWSLIGVGALAWAVGDTYWWLALSGRDQVPVPSIADGFYLTLYPLLYAGVLLLMRARVPRFDARHWLDAIAAALIVGAVGAAVLMPSILAANSGSDTASVATNLAYPLSDLLVLCLVAGLAGLMGWRPGRAIGLLALGCVTFALADSVYLFQVAAGTYSEGGLIDVFWPLGMLCIGLAAWQSPRRVSTARLDGWGVMVLPGAVALGATALLVYDHYAPAAAAAVWLAAAALVVCMARAGLTFRANIAQASTDALTALPNRRLFHDRVGQAILRGRRHGERVAVLIIDIDRFKEVNDTLGHHSGDLMLQEIARRLRAGLRDSDTVARLGGDEFGVLLPRIADAAAAEALAGALGGAIAAPMVIDDISLESEASIGIALFPDHGDDLEALLRRADVAMYTAKAESLDYSLYGEEREDAGPARLGMIGELRRAIARDELVLHYQPKVSLVTGEVQGVEALVRWQHPERGLLGPGAFIPIAEQTSLIRPLTMHVIERSLEQCRRWENQGHTLSVAVNISARNLLDPGFAEAVAAGLRRWGLYPGRLELEITETALMENHARVAEALRTLDRLGVVLAIDDFGVGYSSLSYLKSLPIGVLKIDRSFVTAMCSHDADAMIVRSTVDLGHSLGLRVVAEGIEDEEALRALRALGCGLGQGFHLGRPLPGPALSAWLDAGAGAAAQARPG